MIARFVSPLVLGMLAVARAAGPPPVAPWSDPSTWDVRLCSENEPGTPFIMSGRVFGLDSMPAVGLKLYVYHADSDGSYVSEPGGLNRIAAVLRTDSLGRYRIRTIIPGKYEGPRHVHFEEWNGAHPVRSTFVALYTKRGTPAIPGENDWADNDARPRMGFLTLDSSGVCRCAKDLWMVNMLTLPAAYDSQMTALRHKLEPWRK